MTEVFIKYNPYTVETTIKIDGEEISSENKLDSFKNERLQVWLDQLIPCLSEELNEDNFKIIFKGTDLDYEDVKEKCCSYDNIKIDLEHIKAKESNDKIEELSKLIDHMQKGPFEEFKNPKIKENFNKAINSEYEIGVIATMSSGKSTLINALLGKELMPSKNEACTAKIATIKNRDGCKEFRARCLDFNKREVIPFSNVKYEDMDKFNESPEVSYIEIEGDIPNISSRKMNLVLVDTPGPNNSQDRSHRDYTFSVIKNNTYKPMILYVLNGTQLGTEDDSSLLSTVSEVMKVGGKQSKDRFIFVINKVDNFDPDRESIPTMINKARIYLEKHGIKNPNIYPVSAEMAKVIRMDQNGYKLTRSQRNKLRDCELFNDEPSMHMLQYTSLSNTIKDKINKKINIFKDNDDHYKEALYHSGIPYVEEAINEYLDKYAVTSKITSAVNSFKKIIEEKEMFQNIQNEIKLNEESRKELHKQMKQLEDIIKKGQKSKEFKGKIDNLDCSEEENKRISNITGKIESKLLQISNKFRNNKISKSEADLIINKLNKELAYLESDIFTDLNIIINSSLKDKAQNILDEYKNHLRYLIGKENHNKFKWDNVELISKNLPNSEELVNQYMYTKTEKIGEEWIENTNKKWYKPWTWFEESGYYKSIYEDREYVDVDKLCEDVIYPFKEHLYENRDDCINYINKHQERLKDYFKDEIEKLDNIVLIKIQELKDLSKDKISLDRKIESEKENQKWLDNLVMKLNSILEI